MEVDRNATVAASDDADAIENRAAERALGAAGCDHVDFEKDTGEDLASAEEAGQRLLVVGPAHHPVVGGIELPAADDDVGRVGVLGHREQRVRRHRRDEVPERERPPDQLGGGAVGIEHDGDVLCGGAAGQQAGEGIGELAQEAQPHAMSHRVGQDVEGAVHRREGIVELGAGEARISIAEAASVVELDPEVVARLGHERWVVDRVGLHDGRRDAAGDLAQRREHGSDEELRLRRRQGSPHPSRWYFRHPQQTDQETRLVGAVAGAAPQRAASAPQRAGVDLVGNVVTHEGEDCGRIAAELRGLRDQERIGEIRLGCGGERRGW